MSDIVSMMTVCVCECGVMCGPGQPECRSPPSAPEAAPSLAPAPSVPARPSSVSVGILLPVSKMLCHKELSRCEGQSCGQ